MKSFLSLLIASVAINTELFAAEAGMPQLDPTYWASQAFWLILVFTVLYISISKFYLPKIKDNLDNRENKIKEDLENANKFKEESEAKLREYDLILENAKKEVLKIHFESKSTLDKDIQSKKESMEKEIDKEILKAQKDFNVDKCLLEFFDNQQIDEIEKKTELSMQHKGAIHCGSFSNEKMSYLFNGDEKIESLVIAVIVLQEEIGLLKLGSYDRTKYLGDEDTTFIEYIRDVLEKKLMK